MRGDGRIFQRGQWLWISYCRNGVEQREPALGKDGKNTNDARVAAKFLKSRTDALAAERAGGPAFVTPAARRLLISDLCDALKADFELRGKASPQNLCNLAKVSDKFGDTLALGLTPEHVDSYIQEQLAFGARPATINRTLQLLHQSLALAVKRGTLARVPYIRRLSEAGNARQGYFSEQELAAVICALPEDLRDFVSFAAATGMRRGEIISLEWSDVHGDVITLRGENSKNGEARNIPVVGALAGILERRRAASRIEENGTTRVVHHIFSREGNAVGRFDKSWAAACVSAGCGVMVCPRCDAKGIARTCPTCKVSTLYRGRIFHDLRRHAVRSMVRAGVPQAVAMKISGHKTDNMFRRYNIVATDDLRVALEATEKYREEAKRKVVSIG